MKTFNTSILTKCRCRLTSGKGKNESRHRSGLAPLEMVLVLPLLLMFMGIIVVFGYAASWKIRSEVVARDVAWKLRYPRHGSYSHTTKTDLEGSSVLELHERSPEWQEARDDNERLESSRSGGQSIESYQDDEVVTAPIIRGEIPEVDVNEDVLDFTRSVSQGVAEIDRPAPIMSEMGRVNFVTSNSFLDDEFQYTRMSWVTPRGDLRGIAGNFGRRIPVIWETELDYLFDDAGITEAIATIDAVRDPIVMAIDEDMEFYTYMRRIQEWRTYPDGTREKYFIMGEPLPTPPNPASYRYIPDFSPPRGVRTSGYQLDRDWVLEQIVSPHVQRLVNKPIEMATRTISLYMNVLNHNEDELCSPPLSQSEINMLEGQVEALNSYLDRMRDR